MKHIVQNRWVWFVARILLGAIFLTAAITKIQNIPGFTATVNGYNMLPYVLADIYSLVVPWVELFAGCALILGTFVRFTALLTVPMTISFIIASIYAIVNATGGLCGCFGTLLKMNHPTSLAIDVIMLGLAALLFTHKERYFLSLEQLLDKTFGVRMAHRTFSNVSQVASLIIVMAVVAVAGGTHFTSPPLMTPIATYQLPAPFDQQVGNYIDSGTPVLFIVYAEGCGPCEEAKPVIDALETEFGSRVAFMRVDYWQYESQMKQMGVINTPTLFLFTGKNPGGAFEASMRQSTGLRQDILRAALTGASN